ncbi:UNVERIFIED_CONTAM: dipicolinate synthase subunit A [Acetivibrio alkalicellulosi]
MSRNKIAVIGGDLRSIKLAELLRDQRRDISIFGFKKYDFKMNIKESDSIDEVIKNSDIIVGPFPCSNDNETINAPYHVEKIYLKDIFSKMKKNQLFIAGRLDKEICDMAKNNHVNCIDLLLREEMAVLNAIPTAEGAIQIAMEEMPITLHASNAMILGYGRIGKILAKILDGIGANVYVEARKCSDLAWIRSYGYTPVPLNELNEKLNTADVVFNTIPHIILDDIALQKISKDCLIIDLASKPGGVDFEKAKELGLKVIWALSLPGKVAPVTAAKFIRDTINNIVDEMGG